MNNKDIKLTLPYKQGKVTIEKPGRINLLFGKNGSGKTIILETLCNNKHRSLYMNSDGMIAGAYGMLTYMLDGNRNERVLDAMRCVDDRIKNVLYVKDYLEYEKPCVEFNGIGELPFYCIGSGAKKACFIMLGCIDVSTGIFAIDEFENSIHASAYKDLWGSVIRACVENDVQLFASANSDDIVYSLVAANEERGDSSVPICGYKLIRKKDNGIEVLRYDNKQLKTCAELKMSII